MAALSLLQEKQAELFKKEIELKKEDDKAVEESIKLQERMAKAVAGAGNTYAKVQAIQSEEANLLNGVNKAQESLNKTQKEYNELLELFKNNFTPDTFKEMADGAKDFAESIKDASDSDLSKDTFAEDSVDAFIDSRNAITKAAEKGAGEIEDIEKSKNDRLLQEQVDYNLASAALDKTKSDKEVLAAKETREKIFAITQTGAQAISMIGNQLFTLTHR